MRIKMNSYDEMKRYYIDNEIGKERKYYEIVKNYIQYYHFKARRSRLLFYIMSCIKIIVVASIPIFQVMNKLSVEWATIASAISLIMDGFIALFRVQDKWHLYRSTSNALLKEQRQYMMRAGKYGNNKDNSLELYIKNVESIIENESKEWYSTVKNTNETLKAKVDGN